LCSEPLFQCSECVKRYTTKGALKLHTETAHRGVRFPCPHCPVSLSNRQALDRHIRNVHEVVVCRFKCPSCGKAFKVRVGVNVPLVGKPLRYSKGILAVEASSTTMCCTYVFIWLQGCE
jgi:predicted RNA-binding Zn-ribbon protein involved in translation (DUF1610 family)